MPSLFSILAKKKRFNALQAFSTELVLFSQNTFAIILRCANYLRGSGSLFLLNVAINQDVLELTTSRKFGLFLLSFLKQHTLTRFTLLIDYTLLDFPGKFLRFEGVILLLSPHYNFRLKVRWFTNELIPLATITLLYRAAFWFEREIWDMFGVLFRNHGDLRRILTDYGFFGHPLRKDYPLTGFSEIFYDDVSRTIITAPVSLAQEYRFYTFFNPWVKV